jgi:uncharacterized protein (UPF0548 family)
VCGPRLLRPRRTLDHRPFGLGRRAVKVAGVHVPRVSSATVRKALAEARVAALTYDHVGSSLPDTEGPQACEVVSADLGREDGTFERAVRALGAWVPQRSVARVHPADVPLEEGAVALIELRVGPAVVLAPVRVVAVVARPDRFTYAYGTLPGHPERGEESFTIERRVDGRVTFTIRMDAVPTGTALARITAPAGRLLQRRALDRYLRAVAEAAGG